MLQKLFWLSGTFTSMVLFIGKQVNSYSVVHMSNMRTTWEAYVGSVSTAVSTLWVTQKLILVNMLPVKASMKTKLQ